MADYIHGATTKFPKVIYVRRVEVDDGAPYLEVDHGAPENGDAEDGESVGIYELREVKTKRVTHELT